MFSITEAKESDIQTMALLLQTLFEQEADFSPKINLQVNALTTILNNQEIGKLFVAREHNKTIGMASLLFSISTALGGKVAILEDMIVDSKHRNKGIGGALLDHAIDYAQTNKYKRITLLTDTDNKSAHRFYKSKGFETSAMIPFRKLL